MELYTLAVLTVLLLALQGIEARSTYGRRIRLPCNESSDCPQGQCCRNSDGAIVGMQNAFWLGGILGNGTCSTRPSGPNAACGACGCVEGYECYSTFQGVCCPIATCWLREDAERDREHWRKCFNTPGCKLPQSANPGNGLLP